MDDPLSGGLDGAIRSYYDAHAEETRLLEGVSRLESLRTRELVTRFAPAPPATFIDVGGAAGAHAFWLASLGYEVHLLDPVPRLIAVARREGRTAPRGLASAEVGDARDLPFRDRSADCVLLLGPLYHLTDHHDRLHALEEARRVLRPGGLLFAACITRWASILDGLVHDYLADPEFAALVDEDLRSGQHRNPTGRLEYFTTAYFHTPDGFRTEIEASGLRLEGIFGLEGPAAMLTDLEERWADPPRRAALIRVAEELETVPSLLGLSLHLLGVGRSPG